MPSPETMEKLTLLLERTDNLVKNVERSEDLVHKGERLLTAQLLNVLAIHVKQLQLEVANLAK
jgi:hypothetical protein